MFLVMYMIEWQCKTLFIGLISIVSNPTIEMLFREILDIKASICSESHCLVVTHYDRNT